LGSALASALLSLVLAPVLVPVVLSFPLLLGGGQPAQAQTAQILVVTRSVEGDTSYSNSHARMGVKFTTGSSPVTLSHVSLIVTRGNARTVVTIRDGSTTNPTGALVATLKNPATFTANNLNTFTAPANTVLKASTTYFLVLNDGVTNASHRAEFSLTSVNTHRGRNGWRIADDRRVLTGNSWGSATSIPRFAIHGNYIAPDKPTGLTATPGAYSGQVTLS